MASTIGAALGAAGAGVPFVHEDKTYTVGYLTQAVKTAFEAWLKGNALSMLSHLRELLSAEEYLAEKRSLFDEIKTGKLSFHGPVAQEAMSTPDGTLELATLLFGCCRDEMAALITARPDDVRNALDLVLSESAPRKGAAGNA